MLVPLLKGTRVCRGRDWKWGDQDGSGLGTVTKGSADRSDRWVSVTWDAGHSYSYRYGADCCYDVKVADGGMASSGSSVGGKLSVGDVVELASGFERYSDAAGGPLKAGDRGVIVEADESTKPYKVRYIGTDYPGVCVSVCMCVNEAQAAVLIPVMLVYALHLFIR